MQLGRIQGVVGQDPGCDRAGSRVRPGRIQGAVGQDPGCSWAGSRVQLGRIQSAARQDPGRSRSGSRAKPGRIHGVAGPLLYIIYIAYTLHNLTFNTVKDQGFSEHL